MGWGPLPHPQYLIAVVVQGGGLGSQAAAPVVRQGFDYLVAHPEAPAHLGPAAGPGDARRPHRPPVPTTAPPRARPRVDHGDPTPTAHPDDHPATAPRATAATARASPSPAPPAGRL